MFNDFYISDEQKALNELRRDQQVFKLQKLKKKFEDDDIEVKAKKEDLKQLDQNLKIVMNGIGELFKMFRCKNDPLFQLLGMFRLNEEYFIIHLMNISAVVTPRFQIVQNPH